MSSTSGAEAPDQWHFPYFDDDMGAVIGQAFATTDAMLMGRKLYSEWSESWPEHGDDDCGRTINNIAKYVVSDSLEDAAWNNSTLIRGNEAADRLRLLVHPIAVGHGQRLFEDTPNPPTASPPTA